MEFSLLREIIRTGGIAALAYALSLPLLSANDPFAGSWKLNVAKSKLQQPAPESDTVRIETDGSNLRVEQEGIDDKGQPFKLTVEGGFDDSLYTIRGFTHADAITFRRPNARHILAEAKKSGVSVAWIDAEVSGNSLKVNLSMINSEGKEIKSVAILQKE